MRQVVSGHRRLHLPLLWSLQTQKTLALSNIYI